MTKSLFGRSSPAAAEAQLQEPDERRPGAPRLKRWPARREERRASVLQVLSHAGESAAEDRKHSGAAKSQHLTGVLDVTRQKQSRNLRSESFCLSSFSLLLGKRGAPAVKVIKPFRV